jgi:hypothetical protein
MRDSRKDKPPLRRGCAKRRPAPEIRAVPKLPVVFVGVRARREEGRLPQLKAFTYIQRDNSGLYSLISIE